MENRVADSEVRSIIDRTLIQFAARPGENIVHRVSRSFKALQKRRRELDPLNINLAAAEHYMYARFLAGTSGDPSVKMAPVLYGLKKRLYFAFGIQERMATSKNPVLPPNAAVERWGTDGAKAGLIDYTTTTGLSATNYGNALSALATEARRYN